VRSLARRQAAELVAGQGARRTTQRVALEVAAAGLALGSRTAEHAVGLEEGDGVTRVDGRREIRLERWRERVLEGRLEDVDVDLGRQQDVWGDADGCGTQRLEVPRESLLGLAATREGAGCREPAFCLRLDWQTLVDAGVVTIPLVETTVVDASVAWGHVRRVGAGVVRELDERDGVEGIASAEERRQGREREQREVAGCYRVRCHGVSSSADGWKDSWAG
jgi:hypothetical protein